MSDQETRDKRQRKFARQQKHKGHMRGRTKQRAHIRRQIEKAERLYDPTAPGLINFNQE